MNLRKVFKAAKKMEWGLTGSPCFHMCKDGSLCGRPYSHSIHAMAHVLPFHKFVPLIDLLRAVAEEGAKKKPALKCKTPGKFCKTCKCPYCKRQSRGLKKRKK